jgi:hypothetical protein
MICATDFKLALWDKKAGLLAEHPPEFRKTISDEKEALEGASPKAIC